MNGETTTPQQPAGKLLTLDDARCIKGDASKLRPSRIRRVSWLLGATAYAGWVAYLAAVGVLEIVAPKDPPRISHDPFGLFSLYVLPLILIPWLLHLRRRSSATEFAQTECPFCGGEKTFRYPPDQTAGCQECGARFAVTRSVRRSLPKAPAVFTKQPPKPAPVTPLRYIVGVSLMGVVAGLFGLLCFVDLDGYTRATGPDQRTAGLAAVVHAAICVAACVGLILLVRRGRRVAVVEQTREKWRCRRCGHPLLEPGEMRCPECDEPFDRVRLGALHAAPHRPRQ